MKLNLHYFLFTYFRRGCSLKFKSLNSGFLGASWVAQTVENLPAVQGTWVRSSWEDPLEEGMATHYSILAWRISMNREAWWATVLGVAKDPIRLSD